MITKLPTGRVFAIVTVCLLIISSCEKKEQSSSDAAVVQDSLAFGDTKFLSNGLEGKMYLLATGTSKLPDFDTMQSVNTIYAKTINVPARSWRSGFPGLPDRFEWFGIEYKGHFHVIDAGNYQFRLVSDDGSKLFIDDSLIINNDGLHGVLSKSGVINLNSDEHTIKIQYMQGPRWAIALQLFAKLNNGKEQFFPGTYFEISSSSKNLSNNTIIYIAGGVILLVLIIIFIISKNRKTKK